MKTATLLALSSLVATSFAVSAQEPRSAETPAAPAAAAPVVRLPPSPSPVAAPAPPATSPAETTVGAAEFSTPTGLRVGTTSARELSGAVSATDTNRFRDTLHGAAVTVTRPERRGVGGFFAGFANLFNPLAPMAKPDPSPVPAYTYDGQWNSAPLPRGFRDERYHEPQSVIVGFSPEPDPKKAKKRRP